MNKFSNLPIEIKYEIINYLNRKCFKCNEILFYLKNDLYYNYYPPLLNNDESFEGYTVCSLCLFKLQMTSRFCN